MMTVSIARGLLAPNVCPTVRALLAPLSPLCSSSCSLFVCVMPLDLHVPALLVLLPAGSNLHVHVVYFGLTVHW